LEAVVTLVDNAVYVNGQRTADPQSLEIRSVATEFELHELPVQDAISAHQRPPHRAGTNPIQAIPVPARIVLCGRGCVRPTTGGAMARSQQWYDNLSPSKRRRVKARMVNRAALVGAGILIAY
jgi:hypothetical protein